MIVLKKQSKTVSKIIGEQKLSADDIYRKSAYMFEEDVPEGHLLCNTLTSEVIFVTADEDVRDYLISHWYLVSQDFDEAKLMRQVREVGKLISCGMKTGINAYTILPTTDCNARCFYCYESGCEKLVMNEKTAHDLVKYMIDHLGEDAPAENEFNISGSEESVKKGDEQLHLAWFGGEPTYNSKIIDVICDDLTAQGITYASSMISNSYLFDDELVRIAVRKWHLKSIQVTLDGTEEVYNARKAYIYTGENAYRKVLANIRRLLDAEIKVKIRLNMDGENYPDLLALVDELHERFGSNDGLKIYSHIIFQYERGEAKEAERLIGLHEQLEERICSYGMNIAKDTPKLRYTSCMADNPYALVVLPDGRLHSCEHFVDNDIWGSIYTGETKNTPCLSGQTPLSFWQEKIQDFEACEECFLLPDCLLLAHCPDVVTCSDINKQYKQNQARKALIEKYKRYCENHV